MSIKNRLEKLTREQRRKLRKRLARVEAAHLLELDEDELAELLSCGLLGYDELNLEDLEQLIASFSGELSPSEFLESLLK